MINKVTLLGRIGKKDYRSTQNGAFKCQLSIATKRKYLDSKSIQNEVTTWHYVNFYNNLAEIANKYTNVGDLVYIEGEISNRKYDDNGVNRMHHSITATEIKFIPTGRKDQQPSNSDEKNNTQSQETVPDWDTEEIPF